MERARIGHLLGLYRRPVDFVGKTAVAHDGGDPSMVFFLFARSGVTYVRALAIPVDTFFQHVDGGRIYRNQFAETGDS